MAEAPFIVCDNLVRIYKVAELEVVALQGLDLNVAQGEMLGIVGASGSGKTTLLNTLGGLDRPSAGQVRVAGQDLLKMTDRELDDYRRTQVGFVWQQTSRNLIHYLTAQENVQLPMTVAGLGGREKRARARELLDAVGLWERRHHRLAQLSGGQQQRVAIAVALANRPKLLLADEPTGEMDSATAQETLALLHDLNQAYGLTTIIVTHDLQIARQVDRVVAIRDGRTSSEVIRGKHRVDGGRRDADAEAPDAPGPFAEYVVLDSAGRLQVPKEYLEQLDIGDRATLQVRHDGILIRPVAGRRRRAAALLQDLEDAPPDPGTTKTQSWWSRLRDRWLNRQG